MFGEMFTLDRLNSLSKNTMMEHLGIEYTEIGDTYLKGTMPVNHGTVQPMGLLHGGASVVLAESLSSLASTMTLDPTRQYCVGLEINANHIKSVKEGHVTGTASPIHLGKKTQVWEIRIENESEQLVCISRITMAIMDRKV